MFIICDFLQVRGGTPRNRFKHSDFKSVFMYSAHLYMSLVVFWGFFSAFTGSHLSVRFPYYFLLPQTDRLCTARVMIAIKSQAYAFITTVLWVSEWYAFPQILLTILLKVCLNAFVFLQYVISSPLGSTEMWREIDRFLVFLSFGQTSQNNFIIEGLAYASQWKEQRPKKS